MLCLHVLMFCDYFSYFSLMDSLHFAIMGVIVIIITIVIILIIIIVVVVVVIVIIVIITIIIIITTITTITFGSISSVQSCNVILLTHLHGRIAFIYKKTPKLESWRIQNNASHVAWVPPNLRPWAPEFVSKHRGLI